MVDVFYNENGSFSVAWLKNLMQKGLIEEAKIDNRSIEEIKPTDVSGYTRAHFFAGIAGWEIALKLAGWPPEKEVWTGSCPCQPFSTAGKHKGFFDERHLWPIWRELIRECSPANIFGEQVSSKSGRIWLNRVRLDLEGMGYAFGAADLCVASVKSPHIRQRLFWVADRNGSRWKRPRPSQPERRWDNPVLVGNGSSCGVGNSNGKRRTRGIWIAGNDGKETEQTTGQTVEQTSHWIKCADGKFRRIEPGISPLAYGFPGRVDQLCSYGNAINPQIAKEFIKAYEQIL